MPDPTYQIKSESPAAGDLMFWSMAGHESLSRPSHYELTVLSKRDDIQPKDILGHAFDVVFEFDDAAGGAAQRHCKGCAVRFIRGTQVGRHFQYRITLRSWFWLLTRRSNSRILQDQKVLDVIDAVLEDSPIKRLKNTAAGNVIGNHEPHTYCVQYQESDYDFLSRLMEEEGIYYWFDSTEAEPKMHLADALDAAHQPLPAAGTLAYDASQSSESRHAEIVQWISMRQLESGAFASRDRDFTVISKTLSADKTEPDAHELADLEFFEYPGGYDKDADTDGWARLRLDELIGRRQRHWALTHWPDVAVGRRFRFEGSPDGQQDGDYVIAGCVLVATHAGHEGLDDAAQPPSLVGELDATLQADAVNAESASIVQELIRQSPALRAPVAGRACFLLTLLPLDAPWRPPRLTPRRRMPGPQTALVVGKQGEQIWTDEHGRVKVQFHWDRYGKNDENSSCWIRVSHPWAGKGWGAVSIPRIGQEVIVDFLEGDPDQPIVTGRVYNGESQAPYPLPGGAVVSGIKSESHKAKGFNEMSMDDTAGKEKITVHGQFDMGTTVEHDQTTTVHNCRTDAVDVDDSETIGSNQTLSVGADQTITIGANRTESVGAAETITITGHRTETVNGGETVTVNGGRTHTVSGVQSTSISVAETHSVGAGRMHNVGAGEMIDVGGVQAINVGGAQTVSVGGARMVSVGGPQKVNVGAVQSVSVGGAHSLSAAAISESSKGVFKIKAGGTCQVEAPTIVLKAGGSTITMNSGGITIKGSKITIQASGTASFKAGGAIKIKGANLGED